MNYRSIYPLLGLVAVLGCGGPDATVQGTVTIDGQLASGGTIVFHPVDGGPTAYGTIADNGTYALRVGQGDLSDPNTAAVPSGEYIVTAVVNMPSVSDGTLGEAGPPTPGARLTAKKYANKDTSDLQVTVKTGRNVIPLELEGASADENAQEEEAAPEEDAEPEAKPIDQKDQEDKAVDTEAAVPDADAPTPSTEPVPGPQTESENPPDTEEPAPVAEEPTS